MSLILNFMVNRVIYRILVMMQGVVFQFIWCNCSLYEADKTRGVVVLSPQKDTRSGVWYNSLFAAMHEAKKLIRSVLIF